MKAVRLRTEYLKNPVGIDITNPRFSWNCEDGKKQEAYEIRVMDDMGKVIWSTGKVDSEKMHLIPFSYNAVKSGARYTWQVRLMEGGTFGEWSESAFFEMGLLKKSDWQAKWITGEYKPNKKTRYPVDCFRKTVTLASGKSVKRARVYATACGTYELAIGGKKLGEFCFAPGYTDYNRRVQYQTIDISEEVASAGDEFEVEALLASGWYRGSVGAHGIRCEYGVETKLMVQLEITYTDGTKDVVVTDETWEWSNDGAIRYADNKDGEFVDANQMPSFKGRVKLTTHSIYPTASNNVALKEHEHFLGKISKSPSGKTLVDFGQNIAGYVSLRFTAKKGQVLRLRFGELIGKDGELMQSNIQCINKKRITPLQEVLYVCKDGVNEYKTKFGVFGFQMMEIQTGEFEFDDRDYYKDYFTEVVSIYGNSAKEAVDLSDLEAQSIAVYSDLEEVGFFESSNPLLNQFVHGTKWSTKGNSGDIPTDCPTRERHGWTGDAQIFFKTASYLFDYAAFSQKYLRDVFDWQRKDGCLPQIAPYAGVDVYMYVMNGSVGWSDIGIILPYFFYKMNGDIRILEEYYDRMKAYARFMESRCGKWGGVYAKSTGVKGPYKKYLVNAGQSYDEWAEPQDVKMFHWTDFAAPHPEVSTAYTAHMMHLMGEIAKLTGHTEDLAEYKEYEDGCKGAYRELILQKGFEIDTDRQARLVRPLAFHLLDEPSEEFAKKRLVKAIKNYGYRLGTGFLSTPLILEVLQDVDVDVLYKLLENEEIPGWLSMPKAGATTIWEAWEGAEAQGEVASLNHYSKGALCEWLFKGMCGIKVKGENHFEIAPIPGGSFTFAKAQYTSVYGKVTSGWKKENGKTIFEIEIPANTTARVIIGDVIDEEIGAGKARFEL